jgi:hypothetical protein
VNDLGALGFGHFGGGVVEEEVRTGVCCVLVFFPKIYLSRLRKSSRVAVGAGDGGGEFFATHRPPTVLRRLGSS